MLQLGDIQWQERNAAGEERKRKAMQHTEVN